MGLDVVNLTWDFSEEDPSKIRAEIGKSNRHAAVAKDEVILLKKRFDNLAKMTLALWSLLEETGSLTQEQLQMAIERVSLKQNNSIQRCQNCQANISLSSLKHSKCLICGDTFKKSEGIFTDILYDQ